MPNFKGLALVCAAFSAATFSQNVLAQSCIDLSDARYSAKTLSFSAFNEDSSSNMVRVIVSFKQGLNTLNISSIVPGRIIHRLKLVNAVAAEVPASALAQIAKDPRVRLVELDARVHAMGIPAATEKVPAPASQNTPHGITRSGATASWNRVTGKGVTVAIIDTGIDATHPDLKDRVVSGANFSTDDRAAWKDGHGHGTHVAGTVAATDDSVGVVGMAPEASLIAVKVLDDYGSGTYADVTAGVEYAIGKADIANMSLGGTSDNQTLREMMIKAHNNGLIVAAAAGNSGEDWGNPLNYPGAYPEVVSVAAVDDKDLRAYFSTYNKFAAIAAHGVNVLSCEKDGEYARHSGTSMATPHVAGGFALARQAFPNESTVDLKRRVVCNAEDSWPTGRDNWTGFGLLNVPAALDATSSSCSYLTGPVEEPVIAAPVTKGDPSGDKAVTFVKSTALSMVNDGRNARKLLVTVTLVDEKQNPVADAEVVSEIAERGTGPLGSAVGKTNAQGEAQFVLSGFRCGRYLTRVKSSQAANFSTDYGQPEAEIDLGRQ